MPIGRCRLCLLTKDLQDSHFMPASFYRPLKPSPTSHPFVVNPGIQTQTSKQWRGDMFCVDCEDRLNKRGEAWVFDNCWRTVTEFRLRDALLAATPVESRRPHYEAFAAEAIPGVDLEKLAYFGASMFWRACLHG